MPLARNVSRKHGVIFHPTLGYAIPPPIPLTVARRNARERTRVKSVNDSYECLRAHVPAAAKAKRMAKVDIIKHTIEYIQKLQHLVALSSDLSSERVCEARQIAEDVRNLSLKFMHSDFKSSTTLPPYANSPSSRPSFTSSPSGSSSCITSACSPTSYPCSPGSGAPYTCSPNSGATYTSSPNPSSCESAYYSPMSRSDHCAWKGEQNGTRYSHNGYENIHAEEEMENVVDDEVLDAIVEWQTAL